MNMRRTGSGILGVAVAVLLAWASAAFACSPQPKVYSVFPESAAPGSTVKVEGSDIPGTAAVEIRWNGVKGDLLATAPLAGGRFSVPVQIPDIAPGLYSLTLVTADAGVGRTAFEVTGAAAAAPAAAPAQLWPSAGNAPSGSEATSWTPATIGVGLLAVGLIGLFAGSAVAVTRRRRVVAGSQ